MSSSLSESQCSYKYIENETSSSSEKSYYCGSSKGSKFSIGKQFFQQRGRRITTTYNSRNSGCSSRIRNRNRRSSYSSTKSCRSSTIRSWIRKVNESSGVIRTNVGEEFLESNPTCSENSRATMLQAERPDFEEDYLYDGARNFEYIKSNETERDRIKQMFIQGFSNLPPKKRILHDVYSKKLESSTSGFNYGILFQKHSGTIFFVCDHEDHWHVIHDCTYHNYTCRCSIVEHWKCLSGTKKRYSRRVITSFEYGIEHWCNLTIYLSKEGRSIVYMEIAGRVWIPSCEDGCLQIQQDIRIGKERLVEGSRSAIHFHDEQPYGSQGHTSGETNDNGSEGFDNSTGSNERSKADKIIDFLKKYPVSPINHIFSTNIWLKSKYRFFNRNAPLMLNILRIHGAFYNDMSVKELYTHFMSVDPQYLIFNAPQSNTLQYYMSITDSIEAMEKLVDYQFYGNKKKIEHFYNCLFAVLDKLIPKKNSIFILSAPNAGKNFFFDAVIHYCINFGQMGNFNKYHNFPLMECVDKRIILWNEPCMEPSAAETLKCILGGDTCNAKVKYQGDAVINRTPVIILSNSDIFPKSEAFRSRMFKFDWRPANFLKHYTLKPNPLAVFHLFNHYITNKNFNQYNI